MNSTDNEIDSVWGRIQNLASRLDTLVTRVERLEETEKRRISADLHRRCMGKWPDEA